MYLSSGGAGSSGGLDLRKPRENRAESRLWHHWHKKGRASSAILAVRALDGDGDIIHLKIKKDVFETAGS